MAEKNKCLFTLIKKVIRLRQTAACVQNNIVLVGLNKDTQCIAGYRIIPAICTQKDYLHDLSIYLNNYVVNNLSKYPAHSVEINRSQKYSLPVKVFSIIFRYTDRGFFMIPAR